MIKEPEILHVDCQCLSFMHMLRFWFEPESGCIEVDTHLSNRYPWYRRVWVAWLYVLGRDVKHYGYNSTSITQDKLVQIKSLIAKSDDWEASDAGDSR